MPTFTLSPVKILAVDDRSFLDNLGKRVDYKIIIFLYEAHVMQLSIAVDGDFAELKAAEGTEVTLECGISTYGASMKPSVRALAVRA